MSTEPTSRGEIFAGIITLVLFLVLGVTGGMVLERYVIDDDDAVYDEAFTAGRWEGDLEARQQARDDLRWQLPETGRLCIAADQYFTERLCYDVKPDNVDPLQCLNEAEEEGSGIVAAIAYCWQYDPIELIPTKDDGNFQVGIGVEPEWEPNEASGGMWSFCHAGHDFLIRTIGDSAIVEIQRDCKQGGS